MKEILIKLNKVKDLIAAENKFGKIVLFALIARVDLEGKWDVLISAEGLKVNNAQDDLVYFINKLKGEFGDDLSFLSQIVLLVVSEEFIKDISVALLAISTEEGELISNLKILDNFSISQMYVIHRDFSTLNFNENSVVKEGIDDVKRSENFE